MNDIRWKQDRHELGFVYYEMFDMWNQPVGYVKKNGKVYEANVRGRSTFTRRTLNSAKADVEMIYGKLGAN
tara:strand:- start:3810 stop:4022 length:213 start_codon:yes stop_codon:yes gene_type:complete